MRSEPNIIVYCDSCGGSEQVGLTALVRGAYDERNVDAELNRIGWETEDGDYCPERNEERKTEAAASDAP